MARTRNKNTKVKKVGRVGVLAGGPSSEREISLNSGKAVFNALKKAGYNVKLIDVSGNLERDIKKSKINVAFIALHGRFGEDGTAQNILETLNIPYTGSGPLASRLALDKIASRKEFEKVNILVPKYQVVEKDSECSVGLNFPVVVKPQFEGSSIGLSIVENREDLPEALREAYRYDEKVIVEEFIKGREITVGILDNKPLPLVEIIPGGRYYDFIAKYRSPDTKYLIPAPVKRKYCKKAKQLASLAHTALGCRFFCRVDMILGFNGEIYVLEVNSIPGLTGRSLLPKAAQAIGISFQELCVGILEDALTKKTEEKIN